MLKRLRIPFACLACLAGIELAGSVFHVSIVPPRWMACDLGMLLPILACVFIGVFIGDYLLRVLFGLAQAGLFLDVYGNFFSRDLSFGDVNAVYATWTTWLVVYAVSFTIVTHLLRRRFVRRWPAGYCATCGYDLRGLPERRCPECGKPF